MSERSGTISIDKVPMNFIDLKLYRSKEKMLTQSENSPLDDESTLLEQIRSLSDLPDASYKSVGLYLKLPF